MKTLNNNVRTSHVEKQRQPKAELRGQSHSPYEHVRTGSSEVWIGTINTDERAGMPMNKGPGVYERG
jgi:hypothetical protein